MSDKLSQFKGTIYENGYGLIAKKVMKDTELNIVILSLEAIQNKIELKAKLISK